MMNSENLDENFINKTGKLFTAIVEDVFKGIDNKVEREKISKLKKNKQLVEYNGSNYKIYSDLNENFEIIINTNIPIIEKISRLNVLINHIEEMLALRGNSFLDADINFCNAIFNLKNLITENKLTYERQSLFEDYIETPIETPKEKIVADIYKSEFNQSQLLFLFNQMRKEGIITKNISNTKLATAIEILTGLSHKKFSQDLSSLNEIEFSLIQKEQLKSKLEKLSKAVDVLRDKK